MACRVKPALSVPSATTAGRFLSYRAGSSNGEVASFSGASHRNRAELAQLLLMMPMASV